MRVAARGSGKPPIYFLPILIVLACSVAALGKKSSGNTSGNFNSPLTITGIGPESGPPAGGTSVMVAGAGFTHSASVMFGGVTSPAVTYISSTELQVITPAHSSGTVSVVVNESPHNQSAALAGGFTYAATSSTAMGISGVSPSQGPTSGGTVVTLNGTGFQTGAGVAFGSAQSTAVTVASSTQIDAMSPAGSSGTVGITVTDPNSQSASLPSAFTYTSGPSVNSVSPTSGPVTGGTTVTILGNGFQSGATVAFGGVAAASVNYVSSTEIQAVTPSSSAGTVAVAVANTGSQTGTLASAFTFYHTVSLSWAASSSSASGYNVYRSSTSGGPYTRVNSSLVAGTTFTDDNAQAGHTYFYVTTAVDGSAESGYSNQAEAIVPSP